MIIAAIEAGGTKFACGLFMTDCSVRGKPLLLARGTVPTTTPDLTLSAARDLIAAAARDHGRIDYCGIGCFGPVDLHMTSPTWGYITSTPKAGWSGTRHRGLFSGTRQCPRGLRHRRQRRGLRRVPLGRGAGTQGFRLRHGRDRHRRRRLLRTESSSTAWPTPSSATSRSRIGRRRPLLRVPAPSTATASRAWPPAPPWPSAGAPARRSLGSDHEAWELEARYLAKAFAAYAFVLSPERILMGGGVGLRPGLGRTRIAFSWARSSAATSSPSTDPERLASLRAQTGPRLRGRAFRRGRPGPALAARTEPGPRLFPAGSGPCRRALECRLPSSAEN